MKQIKFASFCAVAVLIFSAAGTVFAKKTENRAWFLDFDKNIGIPGGYADNSKRIVNTNDEVYGNVLAIESVTGNTASLGNVFAKSNKTLLLEKDYVLSFDFCAKQENVGYVAQAQSVKRDGSLINYLCFVIDNDGTASFAKGGGWVTPNNGNTSFHQRFDYEANTWHNVKILVDIQDRSVEYYIDENYLGKDENYTNFGTGAFRSFGFLTAESYIDGEVDTKNQIVYFDNFKVTYTDDIMDDVDFENGTDFIQNNPSETIGIQNSSGYMSVVTEENGNRAAAVTTYKADSLSEALMKVYFNGIPENENYSLSFRYKHISGSQVDIVPVADGRIGYFRIMPNGNIKIGINWSGNNMALDTEIPSTSDTWHDIKILFDPVLNTAKWYLDGVMVREYSYNSNNASGVLSSMTVQAIGTEDMVANKTPTVLIDDIRTAVKEDFFAKTEIKNGKIILKFSEYPGSFDKTKVKITDENGNVNSVRNIEVFGKTYNITPEYDFIPGMLYNIEFQDGITSESGKELKNIQAESLPEISDITIIPDSVGGIFSGGNELSFDISAKNTKDSKQSLKGIATVIDEDGNYVWSKDISFGEILSESYTNTITINPQFEWKYGKYYLEITLNADEKTVSAYKKFPFSVIFSNGVKNESMGICNHYTNRYETEAENFDEEIKINVLAGFGINREEFQWDRYEKPAGSYALTENQRILFDTLKENGLRPLSTVYIATWAYGREEGYDSEFMPIPVTEYQRERYAEFLEHAIADTKDYNPLYEISNEWNLNYWNKTHTWKDGTEVILTVKDHYIPLMKTAYDTIKSENENADVIGLTVGNENMLPFIEECLDNGAAEYCDYISIHPYSINQSPEAADVRGLVESIRKLLKNTSKPDMPIVFSEWGWTSAPGVLTEEKQAAYSVRGAALVEDLAEYLVWYNGQEKDYIESVLEQNFGFVSGNKSENPLSAKPVYIAISCYNSLTGDKIAGELIKNENGTYKRYFKGVNKNIIQVWSERGDKVIEIPDNTGAQNAVLYDMYGNSENIFSEDGYFKITVGENPYYLEVPGFAVKSSEFSNKNSEVSLEVSLINNSSETKELTAFIASYSKDGRLLDVQLNKITAESGFDDYIRTPAITVDGEVSVVKGFLWDKNGNPVISKTL